MTHHPAITEAAPIAHTLEDRVAALELYAQHLVFVLDVAGAVHTDSLNRWIDNARVRMLDTGSVPPQQVDALKALQLLVSR